MNKRSLARQGSGKTGLLIIIFSLLILGGGAYFFTRPSEPVDIPQRESGVYEYFWGNGCPHCAVVAEFFDSSDKDEKVNLKKYEVWYNKTNAKIMEDRFNSCPNKPAASQMAVPFLVTPEGECLVGDEPIINLFKSF